MLQVLFTKGTLLDKIQTQLVGEYNLPNVLAAVCIGQYFKVPMDKIKTAIENYAPSNSRSQLTSWKNNQVILDAYNANPSSMKVAVENFAKLLAENKIICLGGMKELGAATNNEHQTLINQLEKSTWAKVVLVGNEFKDCTHHYEYFDTVVAAKKWLNETSQGYTLTKASKFFADGIASDFFWIDK